MPDYDVNGYPNADTTPELLVGGERDDANFTMSGCGPNSQNVGALWVLPLTASGTVTPPQIRIGTAIGGSVPLAIPLQNGDRFGRSVASTGNIESNPPDFIAEIAIGAPIRATMDGSSRPGAVFVVFPTAAGTVSGFREIGGDEPALLGVIPNGAHFGESVAWVGNLFDGDTLGLAVGAPTWPGGGAIVMLELASPEANSSFMPRVLNASDCPSHTDENPMVFGPPFFDEPPAVLGTNWRPTMGKILAKDTSAVVTVRTGLNCPPVDTPYGQLWITGTTLFQQTRSFVGGMARFSIPIPADLSLNQATVYAQGQTFADPGGPMGPLGPMTNSHYTNALVVLVGTTFP